MDKYRYYRSDFPDAKGSGNVLSASCPVCGSTDNLKINRGRGFVHCYTPGCGFHGGEWIDDTRPADEPFGQPITDAQNSENSENRSMTHNHNADGEFKAVNPYETYVTSETQVPVRISDYREGKSEIKFMKVMVPINDDPDDSSPGMSMARKYFNDMGIGVPTAIMAGVLVGERAWDTKLVGHASAEKEAYVTLPSIAYVTTVRGKAMAVKLRTVSMTNGVYDKAFMSDKLHKSLPTPPFGIDAVLNGDASANGPLIITEGEKDVLALRAAGFGCAISIPNGAGEDPRKSLQPFMEVIERFTDVVICGDNDFRGRYLEMRLKYIFKGRARVANVPIEVGKDVADVLLNLGVEGVQRLIAEASTDENCNILRPNDMTDKIIDSLQGRSEESYSLGFGPELDRHLRLTNRGGLIVVTGMPGDGKSDFLIDMAARLIINEKKRFTFCSMEEPNVENLFADLMHRALDRADLSALSYEQYVEEIDFLNGYVACYNIHKGDPSGREIVCECNRQWERFRPDFLVIDNYARLKRDIKESQNETDFVRDLLAELQDWGIAHGVWVIIVAHPRKLDHLPVGETVKASDISGSAHWHNLADFVISIRRDFDLDEKTIDVLKVRDQRICSPGRTVLRHTPSGRHV